MSTTIDLQNLAPGVYTMEALQPLLEAALIVPQPTPNAQLDRFLPYSVAEYVVPSPSPSFGSSCLLIVFYHDTPVGGFVRNYPAYGTTTFAPFCQDGQWYALYSTDYTALRVLRLFNDHIEDWCGQTATPYGFCPTYATVPYYVHADGSAETKENEAQHPPIWIYSQSALQYALALARELPYPQYAVPQAVKDCLDHNAESRKAIESRLNSANVALIAGCYWGDDSNWKLRLVDLRQIAQQQLIVKELFGYVEMPTQIEHIEDMIQMTGLASFDITMTRSFDLDDVDQCPDAVETPADTSD